jgi:hypothetical protein
MENNENQKPLSPQEEKFNDFLKTGDDFSKIEIYRLAKYWYQKALETGIDNELIEKRLVEADRKIKSELKIYKVLGILGILIFITVVAACQI